MEANLWSDEQKEYAEVFDYSKITEKSGVITDYWTNNLLDLILRKLKLERWQAIKLANSRCGYWRMAKVLNTVITNEIIARLGYTSLLDYYLIVYEN